MKPARLFPYLFVLFLLLFLRGASIRYEVFFVSYRTVRGAVNQRKQ